MITGPAAGAARRVVLAAGVLAAAVTVGVLATPGPVGDTGPARTVSPLLVQPGKRIVIPTRAPLSAACTQAQQKQLRAAAAAVTSPTGTDQQTAFVNVVGDPAALPECRGQLPPEYRCRQGSARPAGSDPVPVPYELRAQVNAGGEVGGSAVDPDGLMTLLLAVEPGAGMAQRIADVAQVPARVEQGGRVVRIRVDPADRDVELDLGALPGVWGVTVDPAVLPLIGLTPEQAKDPEAIRRAQLTQFLRDAERTAHDAQRDCARTAVDVTRSP